MALRWRDVAPNGVNGGVVIDRFVPCGPDGFVAEGFELTAAERSKMAKLRASWALVDDGRTPAPPTVASPVAAPAPAPTAPVEAPAAPAVKPEPADDAPEAPEANETKPEAPAPAKPRKKGGKKKKG